MGRARRWLATLTFAGCLPALAAEPLLLRSADMDNNRVLFDRADKQMPGLCIEIMQAMEQAEPGLRFSNQGAPMPPNRIQAYIGNGKLDAICGLLKTPEREANFYYPVTPIFSVRHKIVVRAEDDIVVASFDDIRKLGSRGVIMSPQGSAFASYLREQGGLRVDADSKDSAIMLRRLAEGYGRFFYNGEASIRSYLRHEHLQDKLKLLPTVFKEEPVYFVFGRHLPEPQLQRLEGLLAQMARQGTFKRLYARYGEE